jgi:hypothetical protein
MAFVPARSLALLSALAALWLCTAAQRLAASTCSACVVMNGASIYTDTTPVKNYKNPNTPVARNLLSTGIGIPTAVWCSAGDEVYSGTCYSTSFVVANLQTQCSGWSNIAQASPCPATAPYAFFQSCDCARNCTYQGLAFDGFGARSGSVPPRDVVPAANVVNLLRSCDLCVAARGEWWSASDITSTACSNVSLDIGLIGESWIQTVVPSCHAPGQRFLSRSDVRDVNPFQPAFRFLTSYQCSHGSSFCSSIGMPGANCVAMIVLLLNMPLTALYMTLSRIARKIAITSPLPDAKIRQAILVLFSCLELAFDRYCSASTPAARRRNLIAEFLATYIFWPVTFAMAFACAYTSFALLIIGGALSVIPLFIYFVVFLPLKSCWAWCGGESSSAALSPNCSSADSGVAMVHIAKLGQPSASCSE